MQKKIIPILIVAVCVTIFAVAYQIGAVTDFDFLQNLKSKNEMTNPPVFEEHVEKYLHVTDLEGVHQKRQQLVNYVWMGNMSQKQPTQIVSDYSDSQFSDLSNLKEIEKIEIEMDKGVNSVVYHFIPKISNHKLIIYHQGHDGSFVLGKKTIDYFLENDYSVLALSMPLIGLNNKPVVDTDFGKVHYYHTSILNY